MQGHHQMTSCSWCWAPTTLYYMLSQLVNMILQFHFPQSGWTSGGQLLKSSSTTTIMAIVTTCPLTLILVTNGDYGLWLCNLGLWWRVGQEQGERGRGGGLSTCFRIIKLLIFISKITSLCLYRNLYVNFFILHLYVCE